MQAGRKHSHRTIDVYDLLPPDAPARRSSVRPMRPVLVEDAVFEVVAVAPLPRQHNENPARSAPHARFDLARLAAVAGVHVVNRLERVLSGLSTQAFATLAASLFFVVFWVCGGFAALDRQAVTTPASPFIIERVFTEEVDENGMRLLAVGGMLKNYSDSRLFVPELSVVGAGGELIGAITPSAKELAAGQSVRFFSRFKRAGGKSGAVTIFPTQK